MSSQNLWDYSFTWRIENYSFYNLKYGKTLNSPDFTVAALGNSKWYLQLCPRGFDPEKLPQLEKFISCLLIRCECNEYEEKYDIKFDIQMRLDGELLVKRLGRNVTDKSGRIRGFPKFFPGCEMLDKLKKSNSHNLILRCRIKKKSISCRDIERTEARTLILTDQSSSMIKVKFSEHKLNYNKENIFCLNNSIFQIKLSDLQDNVDITIIRFFLRHSSMCVNGKVVLFDVNGNESLFKVDAFEFQRQKNIWNFPSLISKKQLQDRSSEYVKDGQIVLLLNFIVYRGEQTTEILSCVDAKHEENMENYCQDYCHLYSHKNSKDVKLRSGEGIKLSAHKSVLIARSPVFFAMFNHDTMENRTGVIDFVDVDVKTLKSFLIFLYSDSLGEINYETAFKLLVMADKYFVPLLKKKCAYFLISILSKDNVLDVLTLADMIHDEHLKKTCIHYAGHRMTKIFSSNRSNWIQENSDLHIEISECAKCLQLLPKLQLEK